MPAWTAFPYDAAPLERDLPALAAAWERLHRIDAQPWPDDPAARLAWQHFHAGRFQQAHDAASTAGAAGRAVALRALWTQAHYLERDERARLAALDAVAREAARALETAPGEAALHVALAAALAGTRHGISVAAAAAIGMGARIRESLETALRIEPRHAEAHRALGAFHAETIDTLGADAARREGSEAAPALAAFQQARALAPDSAGVRMAMADALVMLEGGRRIAEADTLYAKAAGCEPADAVERLDVEIARAAGHA